MIRILACICLTTLLLPHRAFATSDEVALDFSSEGIDRSLFRTELGYITGNNMNFSARWESKGTGLRAMLPVGKPDRPPMRFECLMRLEGDFEISTDFTIARLPRPKLPGPKWTGGDPRNLIEISCSAQGRAVSVALYHRPSGEGYSWFSRGTDGPWIGSDEPMKATTRSKTGRLALRRAGERLTFYRGGEDGSLLEIGTCNFCSEPITEIELHVWPQNSTDALDVRFDRLRLAADRIIAVRDLSGSSWIGNGGGGSGSSRSPESGSSHGVRGRDQHADPRRAARASRPCVPRDLVVDSR